MEDNENDIQDIDLTKLSSAERWTEENWEKEMEKHPLFMKDSPTDEMPPLVEAMRQLKYDSECNTKVELAMSYKEDGNYNFKNKK